jgi:hypothetical protein
MTLTAHLPRRRGGQAPHVEQRRLFTSALFVIARAGCVAFIALQLLTFLPVLPAYLTLADHPCRQNCALTIQDARSLTGAGISPHEYATVLFAVALLHVTLATLLAILLLIRRWYDRMALLTACFLVTAPTSFALHRAPIEIGPLQVTAFTLPPLLNLALSSLVAVVVFGVLLLFPSGSFVPGWSWVILVGLIGFTAVISIWPELQVARLIGWPPFGIATAVCIGYRYWRVASAAERKQMKLVAFVFVTVIITSLLLLLPTYSSLGTTIYQPLAVLAYELLLPLAPVTFFIAIQRYHLYAIDQLINKALVYGALSAVLAVVFVGGVIGMQTLARAVTGLDSPVAVVASTLLIAGLFQPLRSRIQKLIDRRFYRAKYDAQKTLAAFSVSLRHEISLTELQERLVTVINETMRPEHVSLWLTPPQVEGRKSSEGATSWPAGGDSVSGA